MIHLKRLYANNFKQLQDLELHFPDQARILVQGKNEAGKSTLFEAVFFALFGAALATETGARGLDDLIGYGVEKARVELDVQAGDRVFKIARTIVRGKSNTWELDLARGDALEEIRGNTAVNKRLIAELGFDGDALLNTCFVEQKKLEKLEGLNKAKREESLAKLLNLDSLVAIEGDLKIRAEDKQELERLKKRAELADIQHELPTHEEQLAKTESQLTLIDLRGAVDGATEELRAVEQLDAAIRALAEQRESAAQRVARIEALKEAMQNVKDARTAAERATENAREIERLKAEQADAHRAIEDAPNLQARSNALRHLAHLLQRLDKIRAAHEASASRAAQLAGAEARFADLTATVAREEQSLAQVETRIREYEVGEALGNWIAARREVAPAGEIEINVQEKQAARDQISRRFRIEVYGLAALLFVFVAAAAIVQPLALVFLALAALALIILAARATVLWRDLAHVAEALGQTEGEARLRASASEVQVGRLRDAEARLAGLQVAIPDTIDLAQSQRVMIAREMENKTLDELRADQESTRERLLNARAVLGELQRQNSIADVANVQQERVQCERVAQKAEAILARWQPRAQSGAQSVEVESDANKIQQARYQTDAQIEQLHKRTNDAARLEKEIKRREQQAQALIAQAREAYDKARAAKPSVSEWNPSLAIEDYNTFGKELRGDYDTLGGETVVKEAREIEGELGRRQGERATRARNAELLIARAKDLLGVNAPASMGLTELEELGARLRGIELGDEQTLRAQHRDLVGRVHSLRDRQSQLERELGLDGQELDRIECRAEWKEKSRQSLVRERGVEIVSLARRRIVQKVLPSTMDYMRRILPALTRDRYHDAQLDPESYKIQVWDERAANGGAFKEKNIFSGGTKDQFSLALRLAFALATLPQERGSAPSFIFLDEPLGSFDDERAEALIYLLTEGEVAQAFNQIFLISHVRVDERLFTHRVVMENGRVAFTDLPTE
jgi:DNA repair protein SbcC/Rad50